ncbi:MAG: PncC family amidohydrolase [Candidatus Omnitrophota bacterium]|jgi:PncC family amidohydrolase
MIIEENIVNQLILKDLRLSLAESCTGGLLANRITNIAGSSQCFNTGFVTYSNEAKTKLLKVPAELLKRKGAVCEDVALLMAKNVRKSTQSDLGIGITGIAGPDGGTKSKPVGLVYIAIASNLESLCLKCQFEGTRTSIKRQASTQALKLVWEFIG